MHVFLGYLHDNISLRLLYSPADAMIILSRQDNLPNTAFSPHAYNTPVVTFNIGGLPDIIGNKTTVYFANLFEKRNLANRESFGKFKRI